MAPRNSIGRLVVGVLAAVLTAGAACAAAPPLAPEDKALVERASDYFDTLGEAKGRFVQTDDRGGVSEGLLLLERPGLARIAYDPPSSRLIVSDGANVSIADPRLKTFNRFPLNASPLSLFLSRDVRVDRGVEITRVDHFADGFALTARDAKHPHAGSVTLTFADHPMRLREWDLTDSQGRTVQVKITSLEPTSGLDPALFEVRDPRGTRIPAVQP